MFHHNNPVPCQSTGFDPNDTNLYVEMKIFTRNEGLEQRESNAQLVHKFNCKTKKDFDNILIRFREKLNEYNNHFNQGLPAVAFNNVGMWIIVQGTLHGMSHLNLNREEGFDSIYLFEQFLIENALWEAAPMVSYRS